MRAAMAATVIAAWVAGMVVLARRELYRGDTERLAQAALLLAPGAEYYALSRDSTRLGYASSNLDTSETGIHLNELLVADLPQTQGVRRLAARSVVNLTRAMKLVNFNFELSGSYTPYAVFGRVEHDSSLLLVVTAGTARPDSTRVPLRGPLMLPTTVPLALVLEQRPHVGKRFTYTVYDPLSGTIEEATVTVKAESLFVVTDSASLDAVTLRWLPVHQDTVRAWRLEQAEGGMVNGWVDEKGRMVQASPMGQFTLRRSAYEIAFQNWSLDNKEHPPVILPAPGAPPPPKAGVGVPR